jgi:CubicO group peptidase (beta-lactamase class C family)
MRRIILAVAFALAFTPIALAQSVDQRQPDIDKIFAQYDKPGSPGCALGVIRDDKLVYTRGYGMANLEHNIPLSSKSVFDIGSTSKQFTATAIVLLAQQGRLSLEDDIRKHLPEIPDYGTKITIRNLLNHTSGIRDYLTLMNLVGVNFDGVTTDDDALRLIARQKALNFKPGQEFLYSNSGFFLLSIIVKRASSKTLREFAQENIFTPLGMKNTHYHDDHTMIVPNRATGYSPNAKGGFVLDMSGFEQTGDGGVYTTVEDLALWDQNFYTGKVGGMDLISQLRTVGVLNSGEKLTYALGLDVGVYKGLKIDSHGGSWAGYRAELIRFRENTTSIVCLCNLGSTDPSSLARKVADIVLEKELTATNTSSNSSQGASLPQAVSVAEGELKAHAGIYRNAATSTLRRISFRDGKLWIDAFGPGFELISLSSSRFKVNRPEINIELIFGHAIAKEPQALSIVTGSGSPVTYSLIEAFTPTADQLTNFTGTFYSEELDTTYSITIEGSKLSVTGRDGAKRPLTPTFRDAFIAPGAAQLEFRRDTSGRVTSFVVHAGRIRNVEFAKTGNSPGASTVR